MRLVIGTCMSALLLAACGGETPAPAEPAPTAAEDPSPDPTRLPTPAQAQTPAAMSLSCGGENFSVAFMDDHATQVNDDGSHTELPVMPPDANAEPGVTIYTDGRVTFARSGDSPGSIRFARGRMAFVDCVVDEMAEPM